ncbi:MAG: SDR family oxidoreductase [Acidobacteriota bacterium]|nr:MAG: SDR family oxidoreductase [Acidobacteriota bacterium]
MRVLVLGAGGMLGHKLVQRLPNHGVETWAGVRGGGDLSRFRFISERRVIGSVEAGEPESVRKAVRLAGPDVVVNAVGVIKQKEEAKHSALTIEINALFPHRLHEICRDAGARLVHISTDCVFSGSRGGYTEEDPTDAQDLYGRSKALGEVVSEGAVTVRTSIIGRELGTSHGLLEWFFSNAGGTVRGFTKAYFSGFTTGALTDIIAGQILPRRDLQGLYHVASERISKFDLLSRVNERLDLGITIEPDETLAIDRSLDGSKFARETGFRAPEWSEMIEGLAEDPSPYQEWRNLTT